MRNLSFSASYTAAMVECGARCPIEAGGWAVTARSRRVMTRARHTSHHELGIPALRL
jgi:hypothetical protein